MCINIYNCIIIYLSWPLCVECYYTCLRCKIGEKGLFKKQGLFSFLSVLYKIKL